MDLENGISSIFPHTVHFLLNDKCNAKCVFCGGDYYRSKSGKLITLEKFRLMAENLHLEHFRNICLAGAGDPLLNPDFMAMVRHANHLYPNTDITVTTNGIALKPELSAELMTAKVSLVNISINAATRESYRRLMQVDQFERVVANARAFITERNKAKAHTLLQMSCAISRINIEELPTLVEVARTIGVRHLNIFYCRFYPAEIRHLNIEASEYRLDDGESLFFHQELSDRMVTEAKALAEQYGISMAHEPLFREKGQPKKCSWTETELLVGFDGEVYPCGGGEVHFKKKVEAGIYTFGNALTQQLEDFWNNETYRKLRISSRRDGDCPISECRSCANLMLHTDRGSHLMQWQGFESEEKPAKQAGKDPLVSVIVPTFNRPDMLVETIKSILAQTYRNIEIVVVNDAGEDVERQVRDVAPDATYINHSRNKGLAGARNTGIRHARGTYIAYLDDDDIFYPNHVEKLVRFLESTGYKVAYADSYRTFQTEVNGTYQVVKRELAHGIDFDYDRILIDNFIPVLCIMHRKECIESSGEFDESLRRHEDWDLWIRMSRSYRFGHIPEITSEFSCRIDGSGMTTGSVPSFLVTRIAIYVKYEHLATPDIRRRQRADTWEFMHHLYSFVEARVEPLLPLFTGGKEAEGLQRLQSLRATGATDHQLASALEDQLGIMALRKGDIAGAITHLDQAFAADTMNPFAAQNLAVAYRRTGRINDAVRVLEKIVEQNESDITSLMALAEIAVESGNLALARRRYEEVAVADPGNCAAAENLDKLPPAAAPKSGIRLKIVVYSFDHPLHACARLRLLAPAEMAADNIELRWGISLDSGKPHLDPSLVEWADLVIVQRFFPAEGTQLFIEHLLSSGKPVIYETDDLLVCVPETNPHKKGADAATPYIFSLMQKAAAITVSTEEMKKAFAGKAEMIHILPNLLDDRIWNAPLHIKHPEEPVVIGYAGTPDHKADLVLLEEVLERLAKKYGPRVAFRFMGCQTERIRQLPGFSSITFEPGYHNYVDTIRNARIDIGLVPLADNRFNRCKSNIKWLEYSASSIAGIYADLPPYRSCVRDNETGILISGYDVGQWVTAISNLIDDADRRHRIAAAARTEVMSRFTLATRGSIFTETWRKIAGHTGAACGKPAIKLKFSFIVLTWNRSAMLDLCLKSIFEAIYYRDNCEVIVGDNGSTDGTADIIAKYPITRHVHKERNVGLEFYRELFDLARGEFIVVIDDDVIEAPRHFDRTFEEYFTLFEGYGYLGLDVIQNSLTNGAKPDKSRYRDDYRSGKIVEEGPVVGCCAAIRRETFTSVNGFEGHKLGMNQGEDLILAHKTRKAGLKTGIIKDIKCLHASGPAYSKQFGYLDRDISKYEEQGMNDYMTPYRTIQEPSSSTKPKVSIIIPVFNKVEYTKQCLEGLATNTEASLNYEVIIIDNASSDGTADYLRTLSGNITIIANNRNIGFAKACNQGARLALGQHLVFLNNDTVPHPRWLEALVKSAENDEADIVGSKLLYPNGRAQHAGVAFSEESIGYHIFNGFPADAPAVNRKRRMQAVTAACFLVGQVLFNELNGFDEGYINGFEDVDFCLRAVERGARILYNPESVLIHFEETSDGRKDHDGSNIRRFLDTWRGRVRCDDLDFYRGEGFKAEKVANGRIKLYRLDVSQPQPNAAVPSPSPSGSSCTAPAPAATPEQTPPATRAGKNGLALKESGDYAGALKKLRESCEAGEPFFTAEGDCLANLGRLPEAMEAYGRALKQNGRDSGALIGIGVVKLLSGKHREAADDFQQALAIAPRDPKALAGLGLAVAGAGNSGEAIPLLADALAADAENLSILHELIKVAYQTGRYAEAEKSLQRYLMHHPADFDMLFSLAGLLFKAGKMAEADDALDKILLFAPDYDGAAELKKKVAELSSRKPDPRAAAAAAQGRKLREEKRYEEALKSFNEALGAGDRSVLVDIGDCRAKTGLFEEAGEAYRQALAADPNNHQALAGLGILALIAGDGKAALANFTQAVAAAPADPAALAGLGMAQAMGGDSAAAFTSLRKALAADPEHLPALHELIKLAYGLGKHHEAEEHLSRYLMYHPADLDLLFSLSGLQYAGGRLAAALESIEKVLLFAPGYDGAEELRRKISEAA